MAKIYISSSFQDLREERRAVADAVTGRGHLAVGMETYRASDEPAVEFCIADVKRCDIYIGLFAFRYGSVIAKQAKCITQLEYEAAGEAGLKRFIFLLREDAPWPVDRTDEDRTRIVALRKLVSGEHMVKFFASPQELAAFVRDVIDFELPGPARDIPAHLPYRCDRGLQELWLDKALNQSAQSEKPIGLIVHGDEQQGHDMYCQRLREEILPKYLGSDGRELQLKPYRLNWPTGASNPDDAHRMLLRELGERILRRPNASEDDIRTQLARLPVPAVIYAYCRGDDWERDGELTTRAYLNLWNAWKLGQAQRLVVMLFIRYRRRKLGLVDKVRFWRSGSPLDDFLNGLANGNPACCFKVLPRLEDIKQQEAEDWANEDEVAAYRPTAEIVAEIGRYYARWRQTKGTDAIPMDELATQLRDALECGEEGRERAA